MQSAHFATVSASTRITPISTTLTKGVDSQNDEPNEVDEALGGHLTQNLDVVGEEIINECERGVLQFLSLLPLTHPNNSHLDLEGWNPQHDGHARLQTVAQARVLVQREHAERNVLSRYGSERGRRRTQSRVHHLEEKSCAPEQCVRSGGLDVREKRRYHVIDVGVEKIMRIPTDDQRRVLEQLDTIRGGGARVHATLVVIPGGEKERRRLHEGKQTLEERSDQLQVGRVRLDRANHHLKEGLCTIDETPR